MKKIGILTFHCSDNFGAMLQTYGSLQWLRNHNYQASVVRYEPPFLTGRHWKIPYFPCYPGKTIKNLRQSLKLTRNTYKGNCKMGKDFAIQKKNMLDFRKKYLTDSRMPKYFLWQLWNLPFTTYVTGSDQIWNPDITFGLRPAYFGGFKTRKTKRTISYGASFGGAAIKEEYQDRFKKLLSNVDAISMREEQAVSFINKMGREAVAVCDPVFLLDASQWKKIAAPQKKSNYILVFATERNEDMYQYAKELAKKEQLEVIELKVRKTTISDGFTEDYTAGPAEFLGYILNAGYVITNSFHATAFSIIFQKNFLAFSHSSRSTRISNLLNLTELMDRGCSGQVSSFSGTTADWNEVQKKIDNVRKSAEDFLNMNL